MANRPSIEPHVALVLCIAAFFFALALLLIGNALIDLSQDARGLPVAFIGAFGLGMSAMFGLRALKERK